MHDMVLAFVVSYKRRHDGNSPTQLEIARAVGSTQPTVAGVLEDLRRMGAIKASGVGMQSARMIEVAGGRWEYDAGANRAARERARLERIKETEL